MICWDLEDVKDEMEEMDTQFINIKDILAHEWHCSHCPSGSPWTTIVLDHDESDSSKLLHHIAGPSGPVAQPNTPYDMSVISREWANPQERDASQLIEIVSDSDEEWASLVMSSTVLDSPPSTIPELENTNPVLVPHRIGGLHLEVSLVHGQRAFHSAGPLPSSPYTYVPPAPNTSSIGSRERHCRADSEEFAPSEDLGFVTNRWIGSLGLHG